MQRLTPAGFPPSNLDFDKEAAMTEAQSTPDERRRQIFVALVEAQDQSMTVSNSRVHVARQSNLPESQVRQIEREGLDNGWPPL